MRRITNESKKLAGRHAPSRLNQNELDLEAGYPVPARDLDGVAQEHFHELAEVLQSAGVLSEHDGIALSEAARIFGELADVRQLMRVTPGAAERDLARYTSLGVRRDALEGLYARYLQRFGLTPDTRGSIVRTTTPKKTASRWAEFMQPTAEGVGQ